jgi:hypothetical protein
VIVDDGVLVERARHHGEGAGGTAVIVRVDPGARRPVDQPRVVDLGGEQELMAAFALRVTGGELPRHGHGRQSLGDGEHEAVAVVTAGGVDGSGRRGAPLIGNEGRRERQTGGHSGLQARRADGLRVTSPDRARSGERPGRGFSNPDSVPSRVDRLGE